MKEKTTVNVNVKVAPLLTIREARPEFRKLRAVDIVHIVLESYIHYIMEVWRGYPIDDSTKADERGR